MTIRVRFIKLESGEYLYDEKNLKVYTCTAPHKLVGILNLVDLSINYNVHV